MSFDIPVLVAGSLLTTVGLALMLRRDPLLVSGDERGLYVGPRVIPWDDVRRLQSFRGGAGTWLRIGTDEGLVEVSDADMVQPAVVLRRSIVDRAGLVGQPFPEPPRGLRAQPGDVFEEWVRPGEVVSQVVPVESAEKPRGRWAGWLAAVAILFKYGKLVLVAGAKALKLGHLLPTMFSMLASVWLYALAWGWWFAGGFVGLLLVHELGHAVVMRAKGLRTSPIVFIPFVGAFISLKDQFRDARTEAEAAWGGPAAGALGATACYVVWLASGHELWLGLATAGFLLNLFNLLPVSPLDGGRIVTAISTWLWVLGLAGAAALGFLLGNPMLFIILILGAVRAFSEWRRRRSGASTAYFQLTPRYRALMACAYFGLCGYLGWMLHRAHELA